MLLRLIARRLSPLGAAALVHDMLVHSHEGFLRLFPAWPANQSAAFSSLRMRGAVLVSAAFSGRAAWAGQVAGRAGGVTNATLFAEAAGTLRILSPWPNAPPAAIAITDSHTGAAAPIDWSSLPGPFGGPLAAFNASKGATYVLSCTAAGGLPCAASPAVE